MLGEMRLAFSVPPTERKIVSTALALQSWILAIVFLCAGTAKWLLSEEQAQRVAFVDLVGRSARAVGLTRWCSAKMTMRLVGAWEVLLAAALVVRRPAHVAGSLALVTSLAAVAYLMWARSHAPRKACGCFGSRGAVTRAMPRAAALVVVGCIAAVEKPATVHFQYLDGLVALAEFCLLGLAAGKSAVTAMIPTNVRRKSSMVVALARWPRGWSRLRSVPPWGSVLAITGVAREAWEAGDRWREGTLMVALWRPKAGIAGQLAEVVASIDLGPQARGWSRAALLLDDAVVMTWNPLSGERVEFRVKG